MPGRLGPRFAIEALFLIALAVGAAYAELAPRWIVLVMAAGWIVVAVLELTAERIWAAAPPWRRPNYYYAPAPAPAPAIPPDVEAVVDEPVRPAPEPVVVAPLPPEPVVVAPLPPEPDEPLATAEAAGAAEEATIVTPAVEAPAAPPTPEPVQAPELEGEGEPEAETEEPSPPRLEPLEPQSRWRWFRRRERAAPVDDAPPPEVPKHVRLLPTRHPAKSDDLLAEHEREESSGG